MQVTARAFWIREPGQGEIFEQELAKAEPNEVRVDLVQRHKPRH